MPGLSNQDTLAVQKEQYRQVIPDLFNKGKKLFSKIMTKGEVKKQSTRSLRGPLHISNPTAFKYASFDGGPLGRGTGSGYDVFTITPLGMLLAVEINAQAEYSTDSSEKATANVVEKESAYGIEEFRNAVDRQLQTAGNGVMATVSSTSGSVITLSTTPFGARLLRKMARYQVYNSALTTNRGSFQALDVQAKLGVTQTVTCDAIPAGTTGTDVIVSDGLSGANPVGIYGLPYFHTNSSTGTVMGISRANTYMQAPIVNASSQSLAMGHFRLAWAAIEQAVGMEAADAQKALLWYMHTAQRSAYAEILQSISRIDRTGRKAIDLGLDLENLEIEGIKVMAHIYADVTRIDLVNLDTWGRGEWKPIDYYTLRDGTWLFPIVGDDGAPLAASVFYFNCGMQFFVDNPLAISSITSLAVPTGYV